MIAPPAIPDSKRQAKNHTAQVRAVIDEIVAGLAGTGE
jgi:hypothetical protein